MAREPRTSGVAVPAAGRAATPRRALLRQPQAALAALLGLVLCLLVYQVPATYQLDLAADGQTLTGFGGAEQNERGGFRWTTGDASLPVPPLGTPALLRVAATGWRPATTAPPVLTAWLDGHLVATWTTTREPAIYEAALPRGLQIAGTRLELRSDTFVPGPQDRRTLGVAISSVEVLSPGAGRRPVVPPLLVLALSALLPVLTWRAARHVRVPSWPALALTIVVALALATAAATDRAGWLMQAPAVVLAVAGLALLAALAPVVIAGATPSVRGAVGAVRHGLLPAWPEWEAVESGELSLARARAVRWTVTGLALGVLALHLASWLVPPETAVWQSYRWGVGYIWQLPPWLAVALAAPVVLLAVPVVNLALWQAAHRLLRPLAAPLRRANPYLVAGMAGLMALPIFWLLRLGTDVFGDAPELQRKIAEEGAIWREREPLDFFLHAQLYRGLYPLTGWDVPTLYAVVSCLAGGVFVATVVLLTALLARRQVDRLLAASLVLTAGFVQLFFGYLESYTLMTAGLAVYLFLGLLCLAGRVGVVWPATALAASALLHPLALAAAPALAVVVLDRWRRRSFTLGAGLRLALATTAGLVVPALLLVALFVGNGYTAERWEIARNQFGGGDRRTFKPLVAVSSPREYYPLLSLDHVRAIVNQQLLVAPLGWPLVVALLAARRPRGLWRDPRFAFLLLAAATTLAFSALWNPDLGARQDWDLLAIGALPVMALAAFLFVTLVPRGPDRRAGGLLLLGVSLYHTSLWVVVNSRLLAPWLGP